MGFVKLKCPSCGADVQLDETREFGFCTYCGTKIVQEKIVVEHRGRISVDGIADKDALLERAFNLIGEWEFDKASERLDIVLDIDPRCYKAYLGKLMCRVGTRTEGGLLRSDTPLSDYYEYDNALKYANAEQRQFLENANQKTIENKEALTQQALRDKAEKDKQARNKALIKIALIIIALLIVRGFIVKDRQTFSSKSKMMDYMVGEWYSQNSNGKVNENDYFLYIFESDGTAYKYRFEKGEKRAIMIENKPFHEEVQYHPFWGYVKIHGVKYVLSEDDILINKEFFGGNDFQKGK